MTWFKKKKEGSAATVQATGNKVAKALASGIIKVQTKWAVWMNRRMAALPLGSQKVVFVVWAVIMLLSCTYIIVNSLYENPLEKKAKHDMKLPRLRLQEPTASSIVVSEGMYQRVQAFKNRMDSLGQTDEGRKHRDSLLKTRPGLMDSIRIVERLYRNK